MKQWIDYCEKGYCRFAYDSSLDEWVDSVASTAEATMTDANHSHWWRWQNTWFAGVNVLPNDEFGRCGDSVALQGEAYEFAQNRIPLCSALDKAQISVCMPGYPQADGAEGFNFRKHKDAAHLDGLLKEDGRRYLREYHAYILGIALNEVCEKSSPVVIYEGSHLLIQAWLQKRFSGESVWESIDLTDEYKSLRHEILETCPRTILPLKKGEAFILHRLSIHGTATWESESATPRKLAFFRPAISVAKEKWLDF